MESNRWKHAIVGVIVLMFAGMIYAWSVLSAPIAQEFTVWTKAQLSLTFTLVMILFCLGQLICGVLSKKMSVKVNLWISAVLFLMGFVITSKMHSLIVLYISFGIICGLASGLSYNGVLSTVIKWFPDKKGLISGILLMGFGIGSFIIGKVYQAYTPADIGGWRSSFVVMGITSFIVLLVCGYFIKKPPENYVPPVNEKTTMKMNDVGLDVNATVMLKESVFWIYYVWAIAMSAAGLAIISQAAGMIKEIGPDITPGAIATLVGMISISNGVGRVITGGMYDRLGRKIAINMVNTLFILTAVFMMLALYNSNLIFLIVGFITAGLAYGGVPTCNSAFISSTFGPSNYPVNFPIVNTVLIFASFSSIIAGGLYDSSQSYMSTFILILGLAVVGIICSFGIAIQAKKLFEK